MLDVVQTANRLIKKHGELATNVAGKRADEVHESGDETGYRLWQQVVIETKVLLARDYAE